ncbi:MAG TPA: prepilin-type N-terminal cleavage/methylation domain-containing protein [Roseateles sp.]
MTGPRPTRGFTLIELILVIVITAALAVFAIPKVVDTTLWRLRSFGDDLLARHQAMLRLALQQRRPIVATFTGTGVSWAYGGNGGANLGSLPCPATESPCIAEGGSRSVTFNSGNGGAVATSTAASLTVTVASGSYSQAYRVETDTGLIYPLP